MTLPRWASETAVQTCVIGDSPAGMCTSGAASSATGLSSVQLRLACPLQARVLPAEVLGNWQFLRDFLTPQSFLHSRSAEPCVGTDWL